MDSKPNKPQPDIAPGSSAHQMGMNEREFRDAGSDGSLRDCGLRVPVQRSRRTRHCRGGQGRGKCGARVEAIAASGYPAAELALLARRRGDDAVPHHARELADDLEGAMVRPHPVLACTKVSPCRIETEH